MDERKKNLSNKITKQRQGELTKERPNDRTT